MKTLLTGGKVLTKNGEFANDLSILWEDGKILALGADCDAYTADKTLDAKGLTVIPGLIDAHTHGRAGYDFSTATKEQMETMKQDYARHGVTSVFATLASGTEDEWNRAIASIQEVGYDGIHLEGCFLNRQKRGAHPERLLVALDPDALNGFLKQIKIPCHVSAAFELDEDGAFAACAQKHGATMALAHTMATAEEARTAIARGVTAFSHLYNAMPALHHREGGAVCVALLGGGYGEIIADGMHICPDMVALAYRCLGVEKTVLITDSMEATGCPDGDYSIAGQPVIVKNGKAVTLDGALAGSTLNLWDGIKNLMSFAGASFADAVICATRNPARMLGVEDSIGSLEVGKRADLLLVDESDMTVKAVYAKGEQVV